MMYELLQSEKPELLMKYVNKAIQQGYKPQGGVCMISRGWGNFLYLQAVVKVESEDGRK